jgi:hypothetical protein
MAILLGSLEIISLTPLSLSSLGAEEEQEMVPTLRRAFHPAPLAAC